MEAPERYNNVPAEGPSILTPTTLMCKSYSLTSKPLIFLKTVAALKQNPAIFPAASLKRIFPLPGSAAEKTQLRSRIEPKPSCQPIFFPPLVEPAFRLS